MRVRHVVLAAAIVMLVIALAVVAGLPDIGRSLDLVTGTGITGATEFALIGLLCWLALAVMVSMVAAGILRQAKHTRGIGRWRWSLAVLVVGVTLLAVGVVRQQSGYRVCCSSSLTAQEAERRVR